MATEKALKEFQPYISESAKQPAVTSISTGQKIVVSNYIFQRNMLLKLNYGVTNCHSDIN